jgi:hypothetical protein
MGVCVCVCLRERLVPSPLARTSAVIEGQQGNTLVLCFAVLCCEHFTMPVAVSDVWMLRLHCLCF